MWSAAFFGRKIVKIGALLILTILALAVICCINLAFEVTAKSQTLLNPNRINWPNCVVGQSYSPNGNVCVNSSGSTTGTYPVLVVSNYSGSTFMESLAACIAGIPVTGGVCDGRGYSGTLTVDEGLTITTPNLLILLPCATIVAPAPMIIAAGVRNVHVQGCSFQGGSAGSGGSGGTIWEYAAPNNEAWQIGDPTYAVDTKGFWMQDVQINLASAALSVTGMKFLRATEVRLDNIYIIGDNQTDQTGIDLDGTGNYTGGTFIDVVIQGTYTGWYLTGHLSGSAVDDYANASTFIKTHVNCATPSGTPTAGTTGIYVAGGDGNTWTGGDVESCSTMMHLGAAATANTVIGLRNEVSTIQYQADSGSTFNYVATGGTFFTGDLIDNGSRNSFWDSFHRTANGVNGDWYASQVDATITNHLRLGTGLGNERGMLNEIQTDYGYRWLYGFSDATAGEQFYQIQDLINNVYRFEIGEYNSGGSTNNQTVMNSAGTGAIILNGSNNAGTGGVIFGSGGGSATQVAAIDSSGNESLGGQLWFFYGSTLAYEWECNSGTSCTLQNANATVPGRVFKSNVNGQTDLDSEGASAVTINNTSTGGTGGLNVYEGGANSSVSAFSVSGTGSVQSASNMQAGGSSGTGDLVAGNHLNQIGTGDFAGVCTMTSATTCTVTFQHSWNFSPTCSITPEFNIGSGQVAWKTWATNVVTVNVAFVTSGTFDVICVGNPN